MERKKKLFRTLFLSAFKLSACTFGGGYVIVPLMRKRFVEELKWIEEQEMLDLISVSQSAPGPIAVNTSLMIGYRMGGVPGALITVLGTVLPPLSIMIIVSFFYQQVKDNPIVSAIMQGMQAGIAAVICSAVLDMGYTVLKHETLFGAILMAGTFAASWFFQINVFWIILVCAGIGLLSGVIRSRRAK